MKFFNSSGLNWNNVDWSRSFDNNQFPESAGGLAVTATSNFIVAGNTIQSDSLYTDAWVLKLDENGKMIWNKILGGRYNDSIFDITLNHDQDIIALGYTWLTPDSASKEGWIFKLDSEGKKIWNRSLGKWNITSFTVNAANEILIGGYKMNDSLENKYHLMVINNSGIKLRERTYTSSGAITGIFTGFDNNIVVGGSGWLFKMTPKGYIIWEHPFDVNDSISCMTHLADGSILLGGLRDSTKRIFMRIDGNGKKAWEKVYDNYETIVVCGMETVRQSEYIGLLTAPDKEMLIYYDNRGDELKRISVPPGFKIHTFKMDSRENLIIQSTTEENITLIKNTGKEL